MVSLVKKIKQEELHTAKTVTRTSDAGHKTEEKRMIYSSDDSHTDEVKGMSWSQKSYS